MKEEEEDMSYSTLLNKALQKEKYDSISYYDYFSYYDYYYDYDYYQH